MKIRIQTLVLTGYLFAYFVNFAHAETPTRITWHGQAAFEIITPSKKVLWIDPWLKNPLNPNAKDGKDPVAAVEKADYLFITHGHGDHVGEAVEIAKKTKATLVTNIELGKNLAKFLQFPSEQMGYATLMNMGGKISIADGEVIVTMVPAVHSSGITLADGATVNGGNPTGFVIEIKKGPTLYHSGDTAYFSDMKLIGKAQKIDLALINIGGRFGMEPDMAVQAAADVKAQYVVPMHFGWGPLTKDPQPFLKDIQKHGMKPLLMEVSRSIEFEGHALKK